jgi:hypothetical protein
VKIPVKRLRFPRHLIPAACRTGAFLGSLLFPLLLLMPSLINLYVITEFQVNKEYISRNLCIQKEVKNSSCKGACYLKNRLEETREASAGIPENKILEELGFKFIPASDAYPPFICMTSGQIYPETTAKLLLVPAGSLFRPPDLIS